MNFKTIATLILLILTKTCFAAAIVEIKYSPPELEKWVPRHLLISKKSYTFNSQTAQIDCNTILKSGYFQSVNYTSEKRINGISLTFKLKANPFPKLFQISNSPLKLSSFFQKRLPKNTPLNWQDFKKTLDESESYVQSKGYPLFRIDSAQLKSDGTIFIDSNPGTIDKLMIEGVPHSISEKLVRFMATQKGNAPYMPYLIKDQKILLDSKLFSYVSPAIIVPKETKKHNTATVIFNTQRYTKNWFDIGLEQLQYENAVGAFYQIYLNRLLTYSDTLSFKHQIQINNTFKNKQYNLLYRHAMLSFFTPIIANYSLYLEEKIESYPNDREVFDTLRKGYRIQFDMPSLFPLITVSNYIQSEKVTPRNTASFTPHSIHSIGSIFQISTIHQSEQYHQGFAFTFKHRLTGRYLNNTLGGVSYNRWESSYKHFHPIKANNTLAFRIQYGKFHPYDTQQKTFESEGFLIGGSTTLRGYKEAFLYGNQRLLGTLEYRWKENKDREWALFSDFGMAAPSIHILSERYYSSLGIGVKFNTALAPIRFDLAKGNEWFLHFNIGQMF